MQKDSKVALARLYIVSNNKQNYEMQSKSSNESNVYIGAPDYLYFFIILHVLY